MEYIIYRHDTLPNRSFKIISRFSPRFFASEGKGLGYTRYATPLVVRTRAYILSLAAVGKSFSILDGAKILKRMEKPLS